MQPWMKSVQQTAIKPPRNGVDDDDAGAEEQSREIIHAEDRFKQLPAGYEARRRINQEKDEDKYGRNDADQVLVVVEAVF